MTSNGFSLDVADTIAALASPPGGADRGIVRLSGNRVLEICRTLVTPDSSWPDLRTPYRITGTIHLDGWFSDVPADLRVWPGTRSYTGQPTVEIHLPGIPPLLEAVIVNAIRLGARLARPGEFTLRAFLAGKVDLVRAEGVLGTIDAVDSRQLQQSLDQLAGGISRRFLAVRSDLLNLLADIEAGLDFVDEDISFISRSETLERVTSAREFLEQIRQQASSRQQSGTSRRVVLAGLPNAGKSTLFNRLLQEEAAIVSSIPGTTRDVLQQSVVWNGQKIVFVDIAGREEVGPADQIMHDAQLRAQAEIDQADLVVWCHSSDQQESNPARDLQPGGRFHGKRVLDILTKAELLTSPRAGMLAVSSHAGTGLDDLRRAICELLTDSQARDPGWLGMTAARCQESLDLAWHSLQRLEAALPDETCGDELLAIDLRQAIDAIGLIVGAVYTDDLLDRVFSRFCIGK